MNSLDPQIRHEALAYLHERIQRDFKTGCWNWTQCTSNGYGDSHFPAFTGKHGGNAHRLSHELHKGPVPEGLWVLHKCGNRLCCNPAHLYAGTPKQNNADAIRHGTLGPGAKNPRSKLTDSAVRDIRERVAKGGKGTQAALAREYGVTHSTICMIVQRKNWAHVA